MLKWGLKWAKFGIFGEMKAFYRFIELKKSEKYKNHEEICNHPCGMWSIRWCRNP